MKPNELVRERAVHHAQHRDDAAGVRAGPHRRSIRFPPTPASRRSTPRTTRTTLQNIRLWDWRALQDTLRQIQEIRTYYDFPDIDIDRYTVDGSVRQMMLAARELNVEKLPESSRNWINEKLIYTHGYGVTMNPVNGFTPEGLPALVLRNMPVQSTIAVAAGDAAGDLLRRADQHRRVREDAAEGIQLPAGRDQQPDVVRRHRRHRARRLLPPPARSRSIAATSPSCRSATTSRRQPAADAAQHPRARRPRSRRSSPSTRIRTSSSATTAGCSWMMDGFTTSDVVSVRAALPPRTRSHQLHAQQREGDRRRVRRHDDVLRLRRRGSDHRRVPRRLPEPLQGRRRRCRPRCASTCATRSCC